MKTLHMDVINAHMNPIVSIIIPCFNQARFLQDCIASLKAQTYPHWEAIIVNDGSPDDTREVALRLAKTDNRIRYKEQENKGLSAARNLGIQEARGEYLQFLDADDLLKPEKFEIQLKMLRHTPGAEIAYCDFAFFEGDDASLTMPSLDVCKTRLCSPDTWRTLLSGNFMCVHAAIVSRRAVTEAGGFDTNLWAAEDFDLWLRLAHRGHKFVGTREVLALYRRVPKSMSSNSIRQNAAAIQALLKVPLYAGNLAGEEKKLWRCRIAREYWWQVPLLLNVDRTAEAWANAVNCFRYSRTLGISAIYRWAVGLMRRQLNKHLLWRLQRGTSSS